MLSSGQSKVFSKKEILGVKIIVSLLFLGRAWQGIFWDLPLRTFFWDQNLLEGVVIVLTGDSWQDYVTNKSVDIDNIINSLGTLLGFFWFACSIAIWFIKKEKKWGKWLMSVASFSLFILALLYYKDKFYALGQLFEYALQISAPLFLVYIIYVGVINSRIINLLKTSVAVTFFCHGLYAYGYYETPAIWIQWCQDVFGFSTEEGARDFLYIIGLIDFAVLPLIFFRISFPFIIWYCIVWGYLTAFARIVGNFYPDMPLESLHQHVYETLYRLGHGYFPFLLWSIWRRDSKFKESVKENED